MCRESLSGLVHDFFKIYYVSQKDEMGNLLHLASDQIRSSARYAIVQIGVDGSLGTGGNNRN